jgi:hypothetical protein
MMLRAPSQESQQMDANLTFLYLVSVASWFSSSSASGHRVHFVVQKSVRFHCCGVGSFHLQIVFDQRDKTMI